MILYQSHCPCQNDSVSVTLSLSEWFCINHTVPVWMILYQPHCQNDSVSTRLVPVRMILYQPHCQNNSVSTTQSLWDWCQNDSVWTILLLSEWFSISHTVRIILYQPHCPCQNDSVSTDMYVICRFAIPMITKTKAIVDCVRKPHILKQSELNLVPSACHPGTLLRSLPWS